ncbi:MAG: branched-chain amino acid ABC transporter permease, partial [Desulfobacterales bacterium]
MSPRPLLKFVIVLIWAFILLFPMLGIEEGRFVWDRVLRVMAVITAAGILVLVYHYFLKGLSFRLKVFDDASTKFRPPRKLLIGLGIAGVLVLPWIADNYTRDIAINVLIYVSLGLGLNIVVGLAGLLDLGYIAFYAVGAYTYALLNTNFGVPFWLALPVGC